MSKQTLVAISAAVLFLVSCCIMTTGVDATDDSTDPVEIIADYSWYENHTTGNYIISDAEDLVGLANIVNGQYGTVEAYNFSGETIVLANDINITGYEWKSIGFGARSDSGIGEGSTPFRGTFDGQDNTITGLTVTKNPNSGDDTVGLFGIVAGGTVKNLTLLKVNISTTNSELTGAVAAMVCEGGTISGCEVGSSASDSTISANRGNGGIVGRMTLSGTITGCTNYATIIATGTGGNTGGIVGAAYYNNTDMTISDCNNYGTIISEGGSVGGIVGLNSADVSGCDNYGAVTGNSASVGGIVGESRGGSSIKDCHNHEGADVTNGMDSTTAKEGGYGTGGIVGWIRYIDKTNYSNNAVVTVSGCTNEASVTSQNTGAGGIVGMLYHGGVVTGCTSSGNISGFNMVAGIVGGVQTTDSEHSDVSCRVIITDNRVSGGTLALKDGQPNIGVIVGHLLSSVYADGSNPCRIAHNSHATVLDNTYDNDYQDIPEIGGEWGNAAYAVIDGVRYGYDTLSDAIDNADGNTVVLISNVTESITIDADETVVIDLNGKTWTNEVGQHTITNNGKLTIDDSAGGGVVDNVSNAKAVIFNNAGGEVTLNGGSFTRSEETGIDPDTPGDNSYYNIENEGTMIIGEGVSVTQNGHHSSLISTSGSGSKDSPTIGYLTINGGYFSGGINTIKNDGACELLIEGGTFVNSTQAVILSYYTTIIKGGSFTAEDDARVVFLNANDDAYPAIGNGDLKIEGGTFIGPNGFEEMDEAGYELSFGTIRISGGTFNVAGQMFVPVDDSTPDIEINGGTFSLDISDYVASGYDIIQNDDGMYVVSEVHMVTFQNGDEILGTASVVDGDEVDPDVIPTISGIPSWCSCRWMADDVEWSPSSPVTEDITLTAQIYISDISVDISVSVDQTEAILNAVVKTAAPSPGISYAWSSETLEVSSDDAICTIAATSSGTVTVTVTVTSGEYSGTATASVQYRPTSGSGDVPQYDITGSGQSTGEIMSGSPTVVITSDGNHSDVSVTVDFNTDDVAASVDVTGSVGSGAVSVSAKPVSSEASQVIEEIAGELESSIEGFNSGTDVKSVDISLTNFSSIDMIIIKLPFDKDGRGYVQSAVAYYIDDATHQRVEATCRIMGGQVWIYTDHNTPYTAMAISYGETPVYEPEPVFGDDEPEQWYPYPGFDDDDDYVPPVYNKLQQSNDDTVTVVACAAAAVVVALMAVFLILDRKRN